MAVALRRPSKGCIHHSDHGSQYCSHDRSCYGNQALKYPCQEREVVMTMLQSRHSTLGWKSPHLVIFGAFEQIAA